MEDPTEGLFMTKVNWKDPRFARWHLSNLGELNDAQKDAFFDDDELDFPDFTEDELKKLCLKVPCRVDLCHGNICNGIEKSWPKRLYGVDNMKELDPDQIERINRKMVKNGVKLFNAYVDAGRLKRRLERRKNRTLAPIFEERYHRIRFNRIKALGNSNTNEESVNETNVADMTENESETENSLQTVINTGELPKQTSANQSNRTRNATNEELQWKSIDEDIGRNVTINDRAITPNTMESLQSFVQRNVLLRSSHVVSTSSGGSNDDDDDDDSEDDNVLTIDEQFNEILSESIVTSSEIQDDGQSESYPIATPRIQSQMHFSELCGPGIEMLRQVQVLHHSLEFDDESYRVDSFDFQDTISQTRTSTQHSNPIQVD